MLADALRFVALTFRPSSTLQAEILSLRRQLALNQERGIKPRRADVATRLGIALLSRLFDWHASLVVVRPETLVRWRRAGFRLLWRLKSCGPQILDGRWSDRLSVSGSAPSNCQTTTHSPRRPHVLVLAISSLGKMAGGPGFRSACHGNLLAAQTLSRSLGAHEPSWKARPTSDEQGDPRAHSDCDSICRMRRLTVDCVRCRCAAARVIPAVARSNWDQWRGVDEPTHRRCRLRCKRGLTHERHRGERCSSLRAR